MRRSISREHGGNMVSTAIARSLGQSVRVRPSLDRSGACETSTERMAVHLAWENWRRRNPVTIRRNIALNSRRRFLITVSDMIRIHDPIY